MRVSCFTRTWIGVITFAAMLALLSDGAWAQRPKPKMYKIEFKVFGANDPTGPALVPFDLATIHYRSKKEDDPDVKFDLEVHKPKPGDKSDLYWVEVEEGWLIDNLVIRVQGAVNPAIVAKLVTRQPMVLYPGASDSKDPFKFTAYITQMNTYRALFREFVEDAPANIRETRRSNLLASFRQQLENMANVRERLPKEASEAEIAIATKLKDEVIKLYFGLPDVATTQECPQPHACYCRPHRCGVLGRLRGR